MWVNKKSERFEETCRIIQEEGLISINPRCVMEAESCDEAKACPPE